MEPEVLYSSKIFLILHLKYILCLITRKALNHMCLLSRTFTPRGHILKGKYYYLQLSTVTPNKY